MKEGTTHLLALLFTGALAFDVNTLDDLELAKTTRHLVFKDLHVPQLNLTDLKSGTLVEFEGRITFDYEERIGYLMVVSGTNVELRGSPGHVFDCQGERWWDGVGGNGGKRKPKFVHVNLTDSVVGALHVRNTPMHAFAIEDSVNVSFVDIFLNSSDGLSQGGHNTDAFDVYNSKDIRITNCTVINQDDCLAVNAGENILFENNVCTGGHGISIGSVGGRAHNDVKNVLVRHCQVTESTNGVRIKTNKNTVGSVANVTFADIELVNISRRGIIIHGNYMNNGTKGAATPGVPITSLTIEHIHGTVLPQGANIYVNVANASNWTVQDVQITGGKLKLECKGIPAGANVSCEV